MKASRPGPGQLVLVGAGPVGVAGARAALEEGVAVSLAAIVDPDPAFRSRAVADLGGTGFADLAGAGPEADRALVAFSSGAESTATAVRILLEQGMHVVTTCEELSDPDPSLRDDLDRRARRSGRVVVATGANPGFAMDRLPLVVAGGVRSLRRVAVERRLDTSRRRGPLVAKTGYGLTPAEFEAGVAEGRLGHVGLDVSARLVAEGLGWEIAGEESTIEPVPGEDGRVAGLHQTARITDPARREVVLDLVMSWQATDPVDRVRLDGDPALVVEIPGGYHGDLGTTARVVAGLRAVDRLEPGFYRPIDLPVWA